MGYVYLHKRKNNGEPFYIGISEKDDDGYGRSKTKKGRNQHWKRIVEKYGYEIEILKDGISWDEAKELEIKYIKEYKENGYKLANMTEGGEGTVGLKISKKHMRKLKESHGKRKIVTTGGLIKILQQYDLDVPVYIGHVSSTSWQPDLEYFDGVSVFDRKMVADDTDDDDGRMYEFYGENCVILVEHCRYDWVKEQFELEKEYLKLDTILQYDETLSEEKSNELSNRKGEIEKRLKINDKFKNK